MCDESCVMLIGLCALYFQRQWCFFNKLIYSFANTYRAVWDRIYFLSSFKNLHLFVYFVKTNFS